MERAHASVAAAIALLLGFAVACAVSLGRDAATFDETAHLVAGLSYLERADFRLNTEHPPLAKLWAAWPVRLLGRDATDYDSTAWRGADPWILGFEALNGPRSSPERRDPARMLGPARLAMLALGIVLGGIVLAWSRELWGMGGATLSLFLFALSPTMLAHARYVTTDLPAALGIVASLWTFWRFTRRPSPMRVVACGVAAGVALATKFSCLLLAPMFLVVGAAWIAIGAPDAAGGRGRRARQLLAALAGIAILALAVVWASYGFRYAATTDPGYALDWGVLDASHGPTADAVRTARELRVVPEAWLHGLATVRASAARRVAYLNGESSIVGWWYYFPEAFLLKTPPALLALLGWAALLARRGTRGHTYDLWALLGPALIYGAVSLTAQLNIGHRHLAPLEPLLFVLLGGLARHAQRTRSGRWALGALLLGYAVSFTAATPRYLSYFNLLAGGPSGAPRYLLDSNIDWGQDLARLGEWSRRNGNPEIHLAYFGTADPAAYGIRYRKLRMVHDFYPGAPESRPAAGDLVAVSVNLLYGLYTDEDDALGRELLRRRLVTTDTLAAWIRLRDEESRAGRRHPTLAAWLPSQGLRRDLVEAIRAELLPAWLTRLRQSAPLVARIGDSIWIYRMTADLSHRETIGPGLPSHDGSG